METIQKKIVDGLQKEKMVEEHIAEESRVRNGSIKELNPDTVERAAKYVVFTGDDEIDYLIIKQLETLRQAVATGKSNDIVKYVMGEHYKTSFIWTINARALKNFLSLRLSKDALWEIREFAKKILKAIPDTHKILYKEFENE